MDFKQMSGKVSHLNQTSSTQGLIQHGGRGTISTSHTTTFRVSGRPVEMRGAHNFGEGDLVSLVGVEKDGTMHPIAFRNDTTGIRADDRPSIVLAVIFSIIAAVMCFITNFYFGTPFLLIAGWAIYKSIERNSRIKEAA